MNPETHDFTEEYVQYISELDHWGKFEAEMVQAGEDLKKIEEEEERLRDIELHDFTSGLNRTS